MPVPNQTAVLYQSSSPVLSVDTETLSPADLETISEPSPGAPYILGPDDVISVTVYLHPELDVPSNVTSGSQGALITSDGTAALPLIGVIDLAGLTLPQAQDKLTSAYGKYVNQPKVSVAILAPQSLKYYLLGAFTAPGVKYPLHQLTLLEALALGGSVDITNADLYQAYVAQGTVKLPVDLYALLVQGDLSQNIPLSGGDTIVIPTSADENAFVFGAVSHPGAVPFKSDGLTLLQALSGAGLDLPSITDSELSQIHIIRARGKTAQFLIVDATKIMNGAAASFVLEPGDIIFVPPTMVATWNQAISELLPSLQTVSAILNPFVSIKYLRQRN